VATDVVPLWTTGVGVTHFVMVLWKRETVTSWVVEVTVVTSAFLPSQAHGMTVLT
jgi:hypothetical protein